MSRCQSPRRENLFISCLQRRVTCQSFCALHRNSFCTRVVIEEGLKAEAGEILTMVSVWWWKVWNCARQTMRQDAADVQRRLASRTWPNFVKRHLRYRRQGRCHSQLRSALTATAFPYHHWCLLIRVYFGIRIYDMYQALVHGKRLHRACSKLVWRVSSHYLRENCYLLRNTPQVDIMSFDNEVPWRSIMVVT